MKTDVSLSLLLLTAIFWSSLSVNGQDLEKRTQEICKTLNTLDPSDFDRADQSALNLIRQIENLGPEARDAVLALKKFACQKNLVGYRAATQKSAIRALANMGDEGVPTLRNILKTVEGDVLFQALLALENAPFLDVAKLLPELKTIANRDAERPTEADVQAEIKAFKDANPGVNLEFHLSSGSQSLDAFREIEIHASMAIDLIVNCPEAKRQAEGFFIERAMRRRHPSFKGLERYVGNPQVISMLGRIASNENDPQLGSEATICLAKIDPTGKVLLTTVLKQFSTIHTDPKSKEFLEAVELFRSHSGAAEINNAKLMEAINEASPKVREKLELELLEKPAQIVKRLSKKLDELKVAKQRDARKIAAELLLLNPDNKSAIDFLIELVEDTSLPESIQLSRRFGRPGPLEPRPLAARDLALVGPENRKRVLEVLRSQMGNYRGSAGYTKPSHLATSAAWSIAQLDRKDTVSLNLIAAQPVAFSNSNKASPFYGQTGKYVAEVLGERVAPYAEKLALQSVSYNQNGASKFAREILLNAKTPISPVNNENPNDKLPVNEYLDLLVKQAFKKIKGKSQQRGVSPLYSKVVAIKSLIEINQHLQPAFKTICAECESPNDDARKIAVRLLGDLRHSPRESIVLLTNACKDKRAIVRCFAAKALGKFGTAAKPAVEQLRSLMSDPYESVRNAATTAIQKIEQESAR